jgi:hypothetical protein
LADAPALRMRRSRAHKAGDHSLCRRCPVVLGRPPAADGREGREIPEAPEIPGDDAGQMRWLAKQLAAAYSADPGNALLARELRMTLQALMPKGRDPVDDELADFFGALQT